MTITLTLVCMQGNKGSCCWLAVLLFCSSLSCKLKGLKNVLGMKPNQTLSWETIGRQKHVARPVNMTVIRKSCVETCAWCSSLLLRCHLECRAHLCAHEMTTMRQRKQRTSHCAGENLKKRRLTSKKNKEKNKKVTNRSQQSRITDSETSHGNKSIKRKNVKLGKQNKLRKSKKKKWQLVQRLYGWIKEMDTMF